MSIERKLGNKDMLSIVRQSWALSWPMTVIMFFLFLMGLCDVYVAGRFGKEVQAAYGVVFQVYFIFGIIGMALSVGSVSLISRLASAQRKRELDTAIGSSLLLALLFGTVMAVVGFFASSLVINAFSIPKQLKSMAIPLLQIYSTGLVFHYLLITTNGVLRAVALIRKSLITMGVICLLNLWLDFSLSLRTPLGYYGIAVATVISTWVGSVLNSVFIKKLSVSVLRVSVPIVTELVRISWPAGLLQVFWQVGTAMLFFILSRLQADTVEIIAAFTNGLKIEAAVFLPAFAFNMANAVVVGNFIGKDQKDRAFHAGILTAVIGVAVVIVMTLIVMLNALSIASFLSNNDTVVKECLRYIYVSLAFEPLMAWGVILGGGLNGAGDTKSVMVIVASSVWLLRLPLSYLLAVFLRGGALYVWWSMNLSVAVQALLLTRRYLKKEWIVHAQVRNS